MTTPAPEPPSPEPFPPSPLPGPPKSDDPPINIVDLPPNQPSPGIPVDNPLPS